MCVLLCLNHECPCPVATLLQSRNDLDRDTKKNFSQKLNAITNKNSTNFRPCPPIRNGLYQLLWLASCSSIEMKVFNVFQLDFKQFYLWLHRQSALFSFKITITTPFSLYQGQNMFNNECTLVTVFLTMMHN